MYMNHLQNNKVNAADNVTCQASLGKDGKCGEIRTLGILKEFHQLYEDKVNKIGDGCNCTSSQIKVEMLHDWVRDLTEQNTLLVQVVEELEHEASERVALLEERLRNSSNTSYEIMKTLQEYDVQNMTDQNDILRRMMYFQSDINNLTEFIRRIRDDGVWSLEGLHFYGVSHEDLCGEVPTSARSLSKERDIEDSDSKLKLELTKQRQDDYDRDTKQREVLIQEQSDQIEKLNNLVEKCTSSMPDRQRLVEELHELRAQLKLKSEEYTKLETSVKDMREALTAEVADKHDNVVALRRECQLLEERCRQADKQTHFKDDIIKEMRKELKQLRSKFERDDTNDNEEMKRKIDELEKENMDLHKTMVEADDEIKILHELVDNYLYGNEETSTILWSHLEEFEKIYDAEQLKKTKIIKTCIKKLHRFKILQTNLKQCVASNRQYVDELLFLNNENREQHETIIALKRNCKQHLPSSRMAITHQIGDNDTILDYNKNNSTIAYPDNDMLRAVCILKTDINTIISWKDNQDVIQLRKQLEGLENALQEVESKDLLIKNKDEMIKIQNDTLNIAQKELKELREKLIETDEEKDTRMQEVCNLQQAFKLNQSTIEELEKVLNNSEEKTNNMQQAADLYVDTIHLLENSKHKAAIEIEQQRITIGNLQDALVSTKHQLEEVQGREASELKEKCDIIYALYQELSEMQNQYIDCYGEIVKLTQIADCLRNSNLDLKVTNINIKQDSEELKKQLVHYKENVLILEENIHKVLYTNETLENNISYLKGELGDLAKELKVLQEILKITNLTTDDQNTAMTNSLHALQEHSESLLEQLKLTQKQVTKEIKLNETSSSKIEELQKLLDMKTKELKQYESDLLLSKSKLESSIHECQDYENKISSMEIQIQEYEKQQKLNDQNVETLLSKYNSDLISLKHKVEILNNMLNEKSDELVRLHAEISVKSDTVSNLMTENKHLNDKAVEEIKKLNLNITNLEEHLNIYKIRCSEITEKYKKCKMDLDHVKQNEAKIKKEYDQERSIFSEKIEISHNEEVKLNNILSNLKAEIEISKANLNEKNEELKILSSTQEETIYLKEEVNKVTRIRNRILAENQKLQEQITKLNINISQFESRNKHISQQLDKCLQELNTLHFAKEKLEERNTQLESEVDRIQRAFNDLNQEISYKNESVINLEQELTETKCFRDEMCAESKVVVINVRSWLQEQERMKASLLNAVREKNMIIEELNLERNLLLKNIKDVAQHYNIMLEELQMYKQYLSRVKVEQYKRSKSSPPIKRSVRTWGSQGSISCDSPINSPVLAEDHNFDLSATFEDSETEAGPIAWIRKVQNISAELQKNNNYWKTRLGMTKELKPVKDGKAELL